jgi:hypothetical protein
MGVWVASLVVGADVGRETGGWGEERITQFNNPLDLFRFGIQAADFNVI